MYVCISAIRSLVFDTNLSMSEGSCRYLLSTQVPVL